MSDLTAPRESNPAPEESGNHPHTERESANGEPAGEPSGQLEGLPYHEPGAPASRWIPDWVPSPPIAAPSTYPPVEGHAGKPPRPPVQIGRRFLPWLFLLVLG